MPFITSSAQVIEVDGQSHQPVTGDYVDIYAGQRFSVIVTANQPVDNYWITTPASVRTSVNNPNCTRFFLVHNIGHANGMM